MKKLIDCLNQDYPINTNWNHQLRIAFIIGLSISIFLIVFQPFGLSRLQAPNKTLLIGGYGIVCSLVLLIDLILLPSLFPLLFKEENWTIARQILFLVWIIFTIGIGNSIYTKIVFNSSVPLSTLFARFQLATITVGILPVLVATVISQNIHLKRNLKEAKNYSENEKKLPEATIDLTIVSENNKDGIQISSANLLFISSEGNYIQVNYTDDENQVKKKLLRNTLTNTESQLEHHHSFFRTHRAYLVNLEKIAEVSGNAQGLKLHFNETYLQVPVSRNYINSFRQAYQANTK